MMLASRGLHRANKNINSSVSVCYTFNMPTFLFILMEQFVLVKCRTCPEWDIRVTNVVQAAPDLALTLYWFSNFSVHKSISETVCSSASWHGAQKSKLTLFTAQLSNFDSNIFFFVLTAISLPQLSVCLWLPSVPGALRCFYGNTSA